MAVYWRDPLPDGKKTRQEIPADVSGLYSPQIERIRQKFFKGVDERYTEYAKSLEPKPVIPHEKITPLIFILIRACVHYALFEGEFYMKSQIESLKETLELFITKYNPKSRSGSITE